MTERYEFMVTARRRSDGAYFYAREAISPEMLARVRAYGDGEALSAEWCRILFPGLVADILALDTTEHGRIGDDADWSGHLGKAYLSDPDDSVD